MVVPETRVDEGIESFASVGYHLNMRTPSNAAVPDASTVVPDCWPTPWVFVPFVSASTAINAPCVPAWDVPIEARSSLIVKSLSRSFGRVTGVVSVDVANRFAPVKVAVPTCTGTVPSKSQRETLTKSFGEDDAAGLVSFNPTR